MKSRLKSRAASLETTGKAMVSDDPASHTNERGIELAVSDRWRRRRQWLNPRLLYDRHLPGKVHFDYGMAKS